MVILFSFTKEYIKGSIFIKPVTLKFSVTVHWRIKSGIFSYKADVFLDPAFLFGKQR